MEHFLYIINKSIPFSFFFTLIVHLITFFITTISNKNVTIKAIMNMGKVLTISPFWWTIFKWLKLWFFKLSFHSFFLKLILALRSISPPHLNNFISLFPFVIIINNKERKNQSMKCIIFVRFNSTRTWNYHSRIHVGIKYQLH